MPYFNFREQPNCFIKKLNSELAIIFATLHHSFQNLNSFEKEKGLS